MQVIKTDLLIIVSKIYFSSITEPVVSIKAKRGTFIKQSTKHEHHHYPSDHLSFIELDIRIHIYLSKQYFTTTKNIPFRVNYWSFPGVLIISYYVPL